MKYHMLQNDFFLSAEWPDFSTRKKKKNPSLKQIPQKPSV